MKAKEVMQILSITRPTLCSYLKKGYIKGCRLPSGQYNYDEDSVETFKKQTIRAAKQVEVEPVESATNQSIDSYEKAIESCLRLFQHLQTFRVLPPGSQQYLTALEDAYKDIIKNNKRG